MVWVALTVNLPTYFVSNPVHNSDTTDLSHCCVRRRCRGVYYLYKLMHIKMLGLGATLDLFLDGNGLLDIQVMEDDIEDIAIFLNDFIF